MKQGTSTSAARVSSVAVYDEDRIALRTIAAQRDTTVAEVVRQLLQQSKAGAQ